MLHVHINTLLQRKNKSLLWLSERTGIEYKRLWLLSGNKTKGITFGQLEALCKAFRCAPGSILKPTRPKKITRARGRRKRSSTAG